MNDMRVDTAAQDLLNFAETVKKRYKGNSELIKFYDRELGDLNHIIELTKFSASDGWKLVSKVRDNRRRRRTCKNENMILQPLYDFLVSGNGNLLNGLSRAAKSTENMKLLASKQHYSPRTDLFSKEQFNQGIK